MHRKVAGDKKKWISGAIAGVLTVAIAGGALYSSKGDAYARPSLVGVETIVKDNSAEHPFNILEIVGDMKNARVGYFVDGEEPVFTASDGTITGESFSDMGSRGEAVAHYMQPSMELTVFNELNGYAFVDEGPFLVDDGATPATNFDENTEGAKLHNSYGLYVDAAGGTGTGRYKKNDTSSDFVKLGDTTVDPEKQFSIEEVVAKVDGTDKSGLFYMDYITFNQSIPTADGATLDNRVKFDLKRYDTSASDVMKQPLKGYEITDASGVTTMYYTKDLFVKNKSFASELDDTDPDPANHKYIISTGTVEEGDIIFIDTAGTESSLQYIGFVGKDSAGELVFYKEGDTIAYPIEGTAGNNSFAEYISDNGTFAPGTVVCTIREMGSSDGGVTKFHVDETNIVSDTALDDGIHCCFTYSLADKMVVNEDGKDAALFGIEDESSFSTPWYHTWWYKTGNTEPYSYVITENDDYDFRKDFTAGVANSFYYKGGLVNKELFKQWVLDVDEADCPNIYVNVTTKVYTEVTPEDIKNADLVYIHDDITDTLHGNDFREDTATELIKEIGADFKPVVVEAPFITTKFGDSFDTNGKKLACFFSLPTMDGIEQYVSDTNTWQISDDQKQVLEKFQMHMYTMMGANHDVSYVSGSVFVNGVRSDLGTTGVFTTTFTDEFSQAKIDGFTYDYDDDHSYDYNFDAVVEDIDQEKFYLSVDKKDVDSFNDKVSKATCIRYILNYGNRRVVTKTGLRVLDIEPFYNREIEKSQNYDILTNGVNNNGKSVDVTKESFLAIRDMFDIEWFKENISSNNPSIDVYGVGVNEFIGKIEDINANYDLIYIGMDTSYMNTKITEEDKNKKKEYLKTNEVVGNTQNDYVYSHFGDTFYTNGMDGANNNSYYSSGIDITPDKLRELQSYVEAGYAVLLSDEFFKINSNGEIEGIDTKRVDSKSYMYDFVYWCMDKGYLGKNVDITYNFENSTATATTGRTRLEEKENFVQYLNISKLDLDVKKQPPLYNPYDNNDPDYHEYLKMNDKGIYTLDFEIELKHDAAADTKNTSYDCKLYIDHDGDGRFEDVEELESLTIYNTNNGEDETMSDGKYHLTTGTTYSISRQVPEGYVGLLPWKLVFYENNRTYTTDHDSLDNVVRVAVQDYSAISDRSNRPEIKILQLTSGNSTATNLDLKGDTTLQEYYKMVDDFQITVEQDTVAHFIDNSATNAGSIFKGGDRLEALYNYDMLVLGFIDMYSWSTNGNKSEEAMLALREYMLSGRSVLFTHDLTSTRLDSTSDWGGLANQYLRDIQGMDRYNYTEGRLSGKKYNSRDLTEYKSRYETKDRGNVDTYGLSDFELLRYNGSTYGLISDYDSQNINGGGEREIGTVGRVNRGQITEYPFRIGDLEQDEITKDYFAGELIRVATTHNQYYQLNLQTDYRDENYDDDVVVWYALSAGSKGKDYSNSDKYKMFILDYNDVVNNYYIYSKGNVMYTGAGHSKISDMQDGNNAEKRLFVNTLVAAYNAGIHAPYPSYKASAEPDAVEVKSINLPYDITLSKEDGENGLLGTTVTVYFKTINNNLQDNKKVINTKYYVEMPSNTGATFTVGSKYYKEIEPVTFMNCTDSGRGDTAHALSNAQVYKLEFNIMDLIGSADLIHDRLNPVIYTRMSTETSYEDMCKADKSNLTVLPALDSMTPIRVNFTELFDLE